MVNRKLWVVANAAGKVFAGISTLSGRALWFVVDGDLEYASTVNALKHKRDARWLALAKRSDVTAEWKEL